MLRTLFLHLKHFFTLRMLLLSTTLFDELVTGFPIIGVPLVRDKLGLTYTQVGLLLSIGAFTKIVFEPIINLLSDRTPRRYWIIGGFFVLSASFLLAGSTNNFLLLLLAFALTAPAGDAGLGQSQATVIDMNPQKSTQTMARWTLMSSIGDLLAPLVITTIVSIQLGWSTLCWLAAAIWLGVALMIAMQPFPRPSAFIEQQDEPKHSLLASFMDALRNPTLLRWALLSAIPDMADEVFLAFATLYLHDVLYASQIVIGLLVTILMIGGLLGLIVLDRFLIRHVKPHIILRWSAVVTMIGLLGFLTTHSLWVAGCMLFIIGSSVSCWYPLAKGQAYAMLPGKSGTVRAVCDLCGMPFLLLPTIVGFLAGHFGLLAGLGFLATAPVLILVLLIGYKPRR